MRYGEKSVSSYEKNVESLNKDIEKQRKNLEDLGKKHAHAVNEQGENSRAAQTLANEYNKQADNLNRLERQMENATEELENMRKEQAFQESSWGKMTTGLENFSSKMNTMGDSLVGFGQNMSMKVTAPIVGAGAAALTAGMNFEEGMSKVQAISGATSEELEQLEDMAKDLGETTRFSATEASEGMSFLAMAGFETNEILDSMPGLLDLAAAGQLDLGRAADITTNVMSGFNLETEETGRVSDILAESAASANTSVEQMGGAMSYVAPVAEGAGLSIEETAAAIGTLSNAGIQGERAGTALRSMIASLQNPTGQTANALKDLGLSAEDVNPSMNSLSEILGTLEDAGMDSSQAMQLVGQEAGPGLIALLSEGSDGLKEFTNDLENSEGAATSMADKMSDNAKGSIREFRSALEGIGIAASEHLIPPLTDIIEKGTTLVRKFGELDKGTQKTIITTLGLAAVIGPLSLVLGTTFRTVGMLTGGLARMTRWMGRSRTNTRVASRGISAVGGSAKKSGGFLKGFGKTAEKTGKGTTKLSGTVKKAGGVFGRFGGVARVAGGALRFMGGPMGLLASIAIPGLIKGGVSLVNHLREDSIPAVEDFGDEVSDATTEAVLGYKNLNDEATVQLNELNWSGQIVSEEIAENLTSTFGQMGEQIKTSLQTDFEESYQSLSNFFANSKTLSEEEQTEILENMKLKQEEQQESVQANQDRIKEIMELASEEKRELTRKERDEINRIQEEMMLTAVKTMSEGEVEQKAILESLEKESGKITARQAAETVKNSKEAKDGTIKEANEKHDEIVRWAIRERDETGSITAEQADAIIKESEEQRDESINNAEEMHEGVVTEAKKQADAHVKEIEWTTGEVLTNWDKLVIDTAKGVNNISDGINWVLDKIGLDNLKIPEWKPKGYTNYYADGTKQDGHPGGPAIVGEKGRELAHIPGYGVTLLGTKGAEFHPNLPKGTSVLPNKHTEKLLKRHGFPGYEDGVGDFFKWALDGPKKLMSKVWEKFPIPELSVGGEFKKIASGIFDFLKDKSLDFVKDEIKDFFTFSPSGTGVERWAGVATTALRMTDQYTAANLQRLLYQMQTESGGNPNAINLWDINAKRGTPSKGLMQVIDPTFRAYKMPGFNDIWNPLDNILASIRYAVARYGSLSRAYRGVGYATGGLIEDEGLYKLAEEGWPEFVIPTAPNRRTEAMKLLALAGRKLTGDGNNKRPNQLPNVNTSNENSYFKEIIGNLSEQVQDTKEIVELLTKLLLKDNNVYLDSRQLSDGLYPHLQRKAEREEISRARAQGRQI